MKMFKHLAVVCVSAFILTAGFMASCKKDTTNTTHNGPVTYCDTAHCGSGTCDSASELCLCPAGYEGYACATQIRTKYIGSYLTSQTCSGGSGSTYNLTISTSSQGTQYIMINNLGNQGYNVTGTISEAYPGAGAYLVSVSQQTVTGTGGIVSVISANGNFSGNNLTLNYQIQTGPTGSSCNLTGTKQ